MKAPTDGDWAERLATALEATIAVVDFPSSKVVRDFVRNAARAELEAYSMRNAPPEGSPQGGH